MFDAGLFLSGAQRDLGPRFDKGTVVGDSVADPFTGPKWLYRMVLGSVARIVSRLAKSAPRSRRRGWDQAGSGAALRGEPHSGRVSREESGDRGIKEGEVVLRMAGRREHLEHPSPQGEALAAMEGSDPLWVDGQERTEDAVVGRPPGFSCALVQSARVDQVRDAQLVRVEGCAGKRLEECPDPSRMIEVDVRHKHVTDSSGSTPARPSPSRRAPRQAVGPVSPSCNPPPPGGDSKPRVPRCPESRGRSFGDRHRGPRRARVAMFVSDA